MASRQRGWLGQEPRQRQRHHHSQERQQGQARRSYLTRRRVLNATAPAAAAVLAACARGERVADKPVTTSGPVTIDLAVQQITNDMGQFMNGQAREIFEQRHPGVTLNLIDNGNAQEKVLAQVAAGTPPHVLQLNGNLVTFYVVKGMLIPLDPYIQKDRDLKPADFAPKMREIFQIRGKEYALPREGGPSVIYYNKSLLQAAGVAPPNDRWTLANEFREAAIKVTRPGEPPVFGTHLDAWRNWVYSNGGDIVDASLTRCTLDQPAAVEALQLYQDFRYRYKCATTPQDNQQQAAMQRFIAGGLAFFPGLRSAGNTRGFVQPHVGIAHYPQGRAGRKFTQPGNGMALMQPPRTADVAWEVIKWYTSAEFQKLHYRQGIGGVVARLSVLQSEEYLNSAIPREWNEFFAKGVAFLRGPSKLSNQPEIDSTIDRELNDFQNGRETAASVTARIAPIVSSLLREGERG